VSRRIAAPAEQLYDLVSDLPRMGDWSPEATGGDWVGDVARPGVGARFRGRNRRTWHRWSTISTVTANEPGQLFAFRVTAGPLAIARWTYRFQPDGDATVVTESFDDERNAVGRTVGRLATGVSDRVEHNRTTMEQTLERLAAAAE
jgi:hypothetical protein